MEQVQESQMVKGQLSGVANIFQGYNTFSDSGCLHALEGIHEDAGASLSVQCKIAKDFKSFTDAINLSASASVSYMGFGASDKASFFKSLSLTTYSISVIAYGHKVSENLVAKTVNFKDGVQIPIPDKPETLKRFYEQYGDSYVSQIKRGGEYIGVFVFYAQTLEEQQIIQNTLSGSGVINGAKFDADLSVKLSNSKVGSNKTKFFSNTSWLQKFAAT